MPTPTLDPQSQAPANPNPVVTLPTNPFEAAAIQLLVAAVNQFSVLGLTALMQVLTHHINTQATK